MNEHPAPSLMVLGCTFDAGKSVLPGSRAVQADLVWLRRQGWEEIMRRHLRFRRCRPGHATGQPRTSTLASAVSKTSVAWPMLSRNPLTCVVLPTGYRPRGCTSSAEAG